MNAALSCTDTSDDSLAITLSGDWMLGGTLPDLGPLLARLSATPKPSEIRFDAGALGDWDTGLVAALVAIRRGA